MNPIVILGIPLLLAAVTRRREEKANGGGAQDLPPVKGGSGLVKPATFSPMGEIVASFPDGSGGSWKQRDAMILDAVRAGHEDPIQWTWVRSVGEGPLEGLILDVPVMADALKIDDVRMNAGFATSQYIADALSARAPDKGPVLMMTPYVDALTYEQAQVKIPYVTQAELPTKGVTTLTRQMIEASQEVDRREAAAVAAAGSLPAVYILGNPGKNWVLTEKFLWDGVHPKSKVPHKQASANHGFYRSPFDPVQNVGVFHGLSHVDYSQVIRFMGPESILHSQADQQSTPVPTAAILKDPNLGPLLSGPKGKPRGKQVGEGHLPFDRHPAVPPMGFAA